MDRSAATVGENPDGSEAVGDRAEMLNRLVRPVKPMRRVFGGQDQMDRRLLRAAVKGFATVKGFAAVKGLEYEEAHAILLARAEKIGFEAPDVTPNYLLIPRQRYQRDKLRGRINRRREMASKFSDDDLDGKGESPDPTFDPESHEKSGGHRR